MFTKHDKHGSKSFVFFFFNFSYLNECFGPLAGFLFQWAANFVIMWSTLINFIQTAISNMQINLI